MYISHDGGKSWVVRNPHPEPYYAGSLATSRFAVYTQTQDGILRSTDKGDTWTSIGGPTGPPDNLSLCVAADSILLAIDSFGNMWRTFNDGGVPLQKPYEKPLLIGATTLFATANVTLCDSSSTESIVGLQQCLGAKLTEVKIFGTDSLAYTAETFHLAGADSFAVTFHPIKPASHVGDLALIYGTDTLHVRLAGYGVAGTTSHSASVTALDVSLKDTIGALVRMPIVITHDRMLSAISFRILYDTSLLVFDRFATSHDSLIPNTDGTLSGIASLSYALQDTAHDTIYAYFYWFPTTTGKTQITIDNITALPTGLGCTLNANQAASGIITGPITCTTSMLSHFVRYGQSPYLSIEPNPAANRVIIHSSLKDPSITLSDALGRISYRSATMGEINVEGFPTGLYYIELQSGAAHITKPLIIAH